MAVERVQLLKQESAALGGDGADEADYPAPLNPTEDAPEVRGLYIETETSNRDGKALISRTGDDITIKDGNNPGGYTLTQLATGGAGLTPAQHRTMLQLIHFIDEGPADGFASGATKEIDGGLFPTEIRWKRADATLLVKKVITRSGGGATNLAPTPIVWTIYDTDGSTVLATVSDAVTYSGVAETGRTRTIS